MAVNIALRRDQAILQKITTCIRRKQAAQRELHRDGAMHTTDSADIMGQISGSPPEKYSCYIGIDATVSFSSLIHQQTVLYSMFPRW